MTKDRVDGPARVHEREGEIVPANAVAVPVQGVVESVGDAVGGEGCLVGAVGQGAVRQAGERLERVRELIARFQRRGTRRVAQRSYAWSDSGERNQ